MAGFVGGALAIQHVKKEGDSELDASDLCHGDLDTHDDGI